MVNRKLFQDGPGIVQPPRLFIGQSQAALKVDGQSLSFPKTFESSDGDVVILSGSDAEQELPHVGFRKIRRFKKSREFAGTVLAIS